MADLIRLRPFVVSKIWGGDRLVKLKGLEQDPPIGETWEVSRHPQGPSKTSTGSLDREMESGELPYLIKFIDTTDYLSVQVHPGDEYAARVEGDTGKTECWLILDADPGEGIYLGLKAGTSKEIFQRAIANGEDLSRYLEFYPVSKGDFFFVPAGSIHAIGKGVLLAEVQQSSGITYRVWDWDRADSAGNKRELHIDKALDVINFSDEKNRKEYFQYKKIGFSENRSLVEHPEFKVEVLLIKDRERFDLENSTRVHSLVVLQGEGRINSEAVASFESVIVKKGMKVLEIEKVGEENFVLLHVY